MLSKVLRDAIRSRGWSVADLAQKTGISYNTVRNYIYRDIQRCDISILRRIATALDMTVDNLLSGGNTDVDIDALLTGKTKGERIKLLRKRAGLTQKALAERIGVSRQYIAAVECGQERPSVKLLRKIADALKVNSYVFYQKIVS